MERPLTRFDPPAVAAHLPDEGRQSGPHGLRLRSLEPGARKLVSSAARVADPLTCLIVLLGGEAGLRCGEIMALPWRDVDLAKRQLSVTQSEWKGHVTAPKSGRLRRVPMTERLALALRDARHLRGPRVVSDDQGRPLTRKVVQILVRHAARPRAGGSGRHSRFSSARSPAMSASFFARDQRLS
jgi:integrase